MKINKTLITLVFGLLVTVNVKSQTLNPTNVIIESGSADIFKGGYTFSYSATGTPWNGALISFGGFENRYDCQINADYGPNGGNRISFRTKNGDTNNGVGTWNSWNELATRGGNYFTGNQIIHGDVGIGTSSPDAKLTVAGNIHAREVKVTVNAGVVPDYVFANDYKLKSLEEVEEYIKQNSHLPEIPSAQEIEKNGLMLAEMNLSLLKKMEEMTLYMIEMKKENEKQDKKIRILESKLLSKN
ncbi:tail fiber protein [Flavobacterium hydatis]|uniref:Peptidase S74 domain-containing protein n=1 Tax=Flavobacterium hydatis TaxID=991 RepID=A0ABX4CMM5_FLAHY|nr:tail fiber protein [Flavobacterium hydatis]OXA98259.1 hypothetical protein B0A62_00200 [Flavobacterium hydatis]